MAQHVSFGLIAFDKTQRDKVIIEQLPNVSYIARRIHARVPPQVLLEDLVHAGILGLLDAVNKYDPNKNVELRHYAAFRIRGAILDSLRAVDWGTRGLRRKARQIECAILGCKVRFGREPTETEIAVELGVTLETLQHLLGDLRALEIVSLQTIGSHEGLSDDVLADPTGEDSDPFCQTLQSEMIILIAKAVGELPQQERQVLALYHYKELTMKNVGAVMGIGESRVSQLYTKATLSLRVRMHELLRTSVPTCLSESVGHR
jgi:RNA polymerase sigma factor for flagellar operon FliA